MVLPKQLPQAQLVQLVTLERKMAMVQVEHAVQPRPIVMKVVLMAFVTNKVCY
jgi:hypothetical protein